MSRLEWTKEAHQAVKERAARLVRAFPGDPDGTYILAALAEIERLQKQVEALQSEDDDTNTKEENALGERKENDK